MFFYNRPQYKHPMNRNCNYLGIGVDPPLEEAPPSIDEEEERSMRGPQIPDRLKEALQKEAEELPEPGSEPAEPGSEPEPEPKEKRGRKVEIRNVASHE